MSTRAQVREALAQLVGQTITGIEIEGDAREDGLAERLIVETSEATVEIETHHVYRESWLEVAQ